MDSQTNFMNGDGENKPQVLPKTSRLQTIMSQWAKVQQSPNIFRQMQQYYPPHFPMEVRYFLCQWIEEQQWDQIDESNHQYAELILNDMLTLLRQKAEELTSQEFFIIRMKLEESVQKLDSIVKTNPMEMVQVIKNCLAMEQKIIEQAEQTTQQQQLNQDLPASDQQGTNEKIMNAIHELLQKTKVTENDSKNLQHKQESFIIRFSDCQRFTGQLQQLSQMPNSQEKINKEAQLRQQKEQIDFQLAQMAQEILHLRVALSKKYEVTIVHLQELQKEILDNELISWKRRQQLAGNGLVMDSTSIDTLQNWCENLADLIWQNRQQIKKSTQLQQQLPIKFPDGEEDILPRLNDTITGLLSSLVTSTFIVEHQPPQVLKKDARFGAVVRLLVGGKLNVHMNPPQVKATIISENQAKDLLRNDVKAKNDTSGDILNNTGIMEFQPGNGQLSISFRNMQLKKIKRADKKGSEAVTEEKFCILFQSEFSVGGNELVFQVWTLSLPVVVTVHGNQECNATATVLWDNAFAEPGRIPFNVPDQVDWSHLADQLNMKFMSHTGKGLSATNLSYIASKLFGNKDSSMVSWTQFNKDTLSGRSFTFWEWFYAIQKLTKEHLKDLWNDEAIIGFVSKNQAQDWLSNRPMGTFLLRFSDSEIGGITIAWTGERQEVWNLAPFTSKDFHIRGLADRIKDLNSLVYLYPNKPKDSVFSKYYTSTVEPVINDGYIRANLKTTLPDHLTTSGEMERQPFSPETVYDMNPNSVQNMDELPMTPDMSRGLAEMDLNHLTEFLPDDIGIPEIDVQQLLVNSYIDSRVVMD
ncbi:signal transducer and activator of transcription 5B-like isoform X1 [Biomphalaria glabrata]|uniref:Signal transducer and activator of transcription n=2 Tax=Biomphalaria glabrata TaxID=6526 RepID=A0A9U8EAI1_BIOGL|nr:signal transducer and activator of transcription 5B-like isoform X1 [Biomphalaria glabrata]KAI8778251.1 signal transducer and activator of transcription 5B [Biomphalaria glabrata]